MFLEGVSHKLTWHYNKVGELQFLIFTSQLGGAILQSSESAGPFGLELALLLKDQLAGSPVANGKVVDATEAKTLSNLEGAQSTVCISINSSEAILV